MAVTTGAIRGAVLVGATAIALFAATGAATAEPNCTKYTLPDQPRVTATTQGIPLDQIVEREVQGVVFRVPAGYHNPWPSRRLGTDEFHEVQFLTFTFWMPSGRHMERNPLSVPGARPCEAGRYPPGRNEYVVTAWLEAPFIDTADTGYITPAQRTANRIRYTGGRDAYRFSEQNGLIRYSRKTGPEAFIFYHSIEGTEPSAQLRCTLPSRRLPNPGCDGHIYYSSEGLGFRYLFPRDALPQWRQIAETVRDLTKKWSAEAPRDAAAGVSR